MRWSMLFLLVPAFLGGCSAVSGDPYDWTITRKPERPYVHAYDRTLVMKVFLAEKQPGGNCKVHLTFEQALDVIRRLDALTCGIPKIVYLVGWQYDGHDSKYPSWAEVNPRLKRAEDATALDSLKWLMAEGFKHHTTVSLHINMFDAFEDSPLWQTYLTQDIVAKDKTGRPLPGEVFGDWKGPDTQSYQLSYAREWETGYAQKRIDALLAMLPIRKAGTIHIDAFHSRVPVRPKDDCVSPYLGYPLSKEVEAQRRILRYFRDQGVDVTCEGSLYDLRIDPFVGLQPMAWHYRVVAPGIPPSLYCGTPMQAEGEIKKDPVGLTGILEKFCLKVVPWYVENQGGTPLTGEDVCLPALWRERTLVAYSRAGCVRAWPLPPGWEGVGRVRVAAITMDGPKPLGVVAVEGGAISLSLAPGQGVVVTAP